MHAYVYKSRRKQDTYLYLARRDDFAAVPEPLRVPLGVPLGVLAFVLELELTPERRLARVDAGAVREALRTQGFYVQLPPAPGSVVPDHA